MAAGPIAVTGATGFLGSHLVEALLRDQQNVRALIRYTSDHRFGSLQHLPSDLQANLQLHIGDLRDQESLDSLLAGASMVYHLGALGSVPYSYQSPSAFVQVNVVGTANLLRACVAQGVGRLLVMSTCEVYGATGGSRPLHEDRALHARSPYAASKIAAEQLAESYGCISELAIVTARGFNIYGPRQSLRNVIPSLVTQALAGGTIRAGNLYPLRDYVFVDDMVGALRMLMSSDTTVGQTFNIGTGIGTSVRDLVEMLAQVTGSHLEVVADSARVRASSAEVPALVADSSAIEKVTGWRPLRSLESGLSAVVEWYRDRGFAARGTEI